jgi:ring-1,2-phenylacetyl-CoA epoxidase subunit PaaD
MVSETAIHQAIAGARAGSSRRVEVDVAAVRSALAEVPDPEIPVVSVVDLGMVEEVHVDRDGIRVTLLPTFVGCPALDLIRSAVEDRLRSFGVAVDVAFGYRVPWTSDRISPAGREKLRASGFAPPSPGEPGADLLIQLGSIAVPCPSCGSRRTVLENAFGPTRCRAIYHCTSCRQPFETFKTI